jgi:cell wall-associated NlpC family hydrolase
MFFMNKNAYVFHVGIYLGNHTYMHSAGKTGPTKSSVFKDGKNYMSRYGSSFVYGRRVHR